MSTPKPEWVKRFAAHLVTLQKMPEQTAIDIARDNWPDAMELTPEEAAEMYIADEPPDEL
jgi:hypothetical protein